jgi:hypothetical protein
MTVKEASIHFNLEEKEIRKRYNAKMIIGARKDGRCIVIPDNTEVIPSKAEIKAFLLQILKQRNNPSHIMSRGLCPDLGSLKCLLRYLYTRGFIGGYRDCESAEEMLTNIQLTEEGFSFVFGEKTYIALNKGFSIPLSINVGCAVF